MPRLRSMRGMVTTCLWRNAPNVDRPCSLQQIIVAIASLDAKKSIAAEIRSVEVTMIRQPWLDGGLSKRNPKTQSPRVIRLGTPHGPHGMGMLWGKVMWSWARAAWCAMLARAAWVPTWRARVSLRPGPTEALAAVKPGYIPEGLTHWHASISA